MIQYTISCEQSTVNIVTAVYACEIRKVGGACSLDNLDIQLTNYN